MGASPPASKKAENISKSTADRCSQFCRSRFLLRQGKACREYCRIVKSFNAAWAEICPSKPIRVRLSSAKKTGCCRAGNTLRFPVSENRTRTFAPVGRIESSKISACIADLSKAEIGGRRHFASAGAHHIACSADAHCRISFLKFTRWPPPCFHAEIIAL